MTETNKMTIAMKNVLESLLESPKTDLELLETIPNFSLELFGKLRELGAIDHIGHLVYITSVGESLNMVNLDI
jgi:hypothetical protein